MDEHEVVFQGKQSTRPQRSWTVRHEHGLQNSPVNCTFLDNRKRRRKFVCTMRLRAPPITLETSTLAGWVGATAAAMAPLVEVLRCDAIGGSDVLHGDDTPVPVLAPGAGKTKTGRLPQRRATANLKDFTGVLHADGSALPAQSRQIAKAGRQDLLGRSSHHPPPTRSSDGAKRWRLKPQRRVASMSPSHCSRAHGTLFFFNEGGRLCV